MASYTHDFKLEFDGTIYEGEVEFNSDGIASYRFADNYDFTIEQMETLTRLINIWLSLYHAFGNGIELIRLKKKP